LFAFLLLNPFFSVVPHLVHHQHCLLEPRGCCFSLLLRVHMALPFFFLSFLYQIFAPFPLVCQPFLLYCSRESSCLQCVAMRRRVHGLCPKGLLPLGESRLTGFVFLCWSDLAKCLFQALIQSALLPPPRNNALPLFRRFCFQLVSRSFLHVYLLSLLAFLSFARPFFLFILLF